jgi:hypothetical protein
MTDYLWHLCYIYAMLGKPPVVTSDDLGLKGTITLATMVQWTRYVQLISLYPLQAFYVLVSYLVSYLV